MAEMLWLYITYEGLKQYKYFRYCKYCQSNKQLYITYEGLKHMWIDTALGLALVVHYL